MSEAKEQSNSVMHDATPSWNGFNYQGKVGIYVVLTLILKELEGYESIADEDFKVFLNSHSIQFEWIEDFSILKDEEYISHHQVKHKEGNAFSTHIKALAQIRGRTKRVLQESDLKKYIEITENKTYENILNELQGLECLDENRALVDDWHSKIDDTSEYYFCLKEFDGFSSRVFANSVVYFHTTEEVSGPANEDMADYKDMPEYLKEDFKGKTTLKELEIFQIYIGTENTDPYELVQTDEALENKIQSLIEKLLEKIHGANFSSMRDDEKNMYYSALQSLVHDHVLYRHSLIRNKENKGNGYLEERPIINFKNFWCLLKHKWVNQDKEYFEIFCQNRFYLAYEAKLTRLWNIAQRQNSTIHCEQYKRLKEYVECFLSSKYKKRYRHLFRELAPHRFLKNKAENIFYSCISDESYIDKVFLTFLSQVSIAQNSGSILIYKDDKKYYPSTVDLSADDECEEREKIIEFQEKMIELKEKEHYTPNSSLIESDFFVVNTLNEESVSGQTFQLRKITDVENDSKGTITEHEIYLKRYQDALEEINKNDN
ncbi:hypothetical protein MMG00_00615 [Ignatzschineria rhizosphaerae]|uniref:DUF4297 domain-containing protein n=1 Tax=Ignatzschineria rhizosphaerae TaxID=2923279 RepID=A0ABY3X3S1_9GAMM|nr:hypothetical protein [Ignatzschineria rhizosphaerae]UNM96411.1 hypothetical protein MMG00_00615 [Ignatzschineria rhizosphaerae]